MVRPPDRACYLAATGAHPVGLRTGRIVRGMRYTPSPGPGKILVVERDPSVAMFVETVLGTWEAFEVTAVSNASEALALIEYEPWDLVLADFELPDAQALRCSRSSAPRLPGCRSR